MKIGVLTFYRAANFGAMLQAYALERYLVARGHEVRFVDEASLYERRPSLLSVICSRSIRGLRVKFARWLAHRKVRFASRMVRLAPGEASDVVLVGSDQVWNSKWYGSPALVEKMFLGEVRRGVRRIAYAASFGFDRWTAAETSVRVGELLRNFERISVRESSGSEIVRQLSGRTDVPCLLDPTLLHPGDFYRSLLKGCDSTWDDTVFLYLLNWSARSDAECALSCANEMGVPKIRRVGSGMLVEEWLTAIAHAGMVVTNSFHGTAFALLFHRPFVALKLSGEYAGMNERIAEILHLVGLDRRFVEPSDEVSIRAAMAEGIDWSAVDERLSRKRLETDAFFLEAGL